MIDPEPQHRDVVVTAEDARVGKLLARRFSIEQLAGKGGMGAVYRARDRSNGELVALKIMTEQGGKNAERFHQEAALLRDLEHDGIVRYVAHGACEDGSLFLAMEWLAGEDLADRLDRGPLTKADTVNLGIRVAAALGEAHQRGIVHRDIKPSNLFLPASDIDRVKILDFGIAHATDQTRLTTNTGGILGTLGYMAPEQARGAAEIDARADVFSLGCVLFECVSGRPAFAGDHVLAILAKILFEDPPSLRDLGIDTLDALLSRMLAKDPQRRPANGIALAAELGAMQNSAPNSLGPQSATPASLTRSEQRLLCVVVVGKIPDALGPTEANDVAPLSTPLDVALREKMRTFDARVERLFDGSVIATLDGQGAATDQAARGARCALVLRSMFPDAPIALATGRGEVYGVFPIGEVIDRAASLLRERQDIEPPRSVIRIDAVTAGLLDARFDVRGRGAGLDLVGERETRDVMRKLLGKPTKCVGRERELALLADTFDECIAETSPRVVLVTGLAGVGKSRLRTEFIASLHARVGPVEVWESRGDPMSAGAPFVMIAPIVRHTAGMVDGEPTEVRRRKLAGRVGRHVPLASRQRVSEFLGELVGTPFLAHASDPLRAARADAIVMGDQVRRAFIELLAHECAATPLVLVLEDLHWGDLPSVNLLDSALRIVRDRPWMILALARPEIDESFPNLWSGRGVTRLELRGLSARASTKLVRDVLGDEISDATVERIVAQATGNAFYLEELIRAVAEGRSDALPETVIAMVQARLEALEPDTRRLLRAASIFGEVFWRDAVAKLLAHSSKDEDLAQRLAQLMEKELIVERATPGFAGEVEYSFRHAVVREAAYGMLTQDDRVLGHRLAGDWFEARGEPDAMLVAEHLDRGGDFARAIGWYRRASDEALAGNDFEAALARAARGIACGAEGETKGALHMVRCDAFAWKSDHALALEESRQAAALFSRGSDAWFVAVGRAVLECRRLGGVDEATSWGESILATWQSDDSSRAPIVAACLAADTLCLLGRLAIGHALIDRIQARIGRDDAIEPYVMGHVHRIFGLRIQLRDGDPSAMATWLAKSIACFDAAGDTRNACVQRANRGFSLLALGDYEESERDLRAAMDVASRLGLLTLVAVCEHNLGAAIARQGRLEEGIAVEKLAVDAFARQGDLRLEAASRTYLARLELENGDIAAARSEATRAVELASALPATRAQALATLARIHLAARAPEPAMHAASEAHQILLRLGAMEGSEERIRLIYAEALHAVGDRDAARAAIVDARDRLMARANRIADARWRATYLERVRESVRTLKLAAEIDR